MKRKNVLLLLFFCYRALGLFAQDTITMMQYNLLYYGNYNSGFADCYETNNNTQTKDEHIRTVLAYVQPDILTVNEFGATQALTNDFLQHNLNINGVNYWQTDNLINYASSEIVNHIFYNSNKFGLKRHVALRTSPRDSDIYELYCKTPSLTAGDTIKLVCIVTHLKAGKGYESSRRACLQTIMDFIWDHYPEDNVLIMGDFNMYGASETGYQLLTRTYSHPDICFVDPLGTAGVGEWSENGAYAPYHTQATHRYSDECFSSGGLDDRFDFILMADEIKFGYRNIRYVTNSYKAVGNDALHFNMSINQNYNYAVPRDVANALFECSDHLPVTMKLSVNAHLNVNDYESPFQAQVAPNPAKNLCQLRFFNPEEGKVSVDLYNIQGQLMKHLEEGFDAGSQSMDIPLNGMTPGFYLMRLSDATNRGETVKIVVM